MDRSQRMPLYEQVKEHILDRVASGAWAVGTPIPPEKDLCQMLSVSRQTVVRALGDLARSGVLERRQGIGTFVSQPRVVHGPLRLQSFSEEMADRGLDARARLLFVGEEQAPPEIRQRLHLSPRDQVARIRRLRLAGGGQTMGIQDAFLPVRLVPALTSDTGRLEGSLYRILQEVYGLRLARAVETVTPSRLCGPEAAMLQCPSGTLAFHVERVTYDDEGRPVEFVRSRMRGDRYRYVLELKRP
jgi:GntR family transcriptional regulator